MKKSIGIIVMILALVGSYQLALAQKYQKVTTHNLSFQKVDGSQVIRVYNINGNVNVEGYNGKQAEVKSEKIIEANSEQDKDEGVSEMQLKTEKVGNTILVYVDAPFIHIRREDDHIHYNVRDHDRDFEYKFNFTIKVPRNTIVHASTINNGNVSVSDVQSVVNARNVNGSVTLKDVAGKTNASTVNGKITATYTSNPQSESTFRTVNGDIDAGFQKDLSADLTFKTLNGDVYTSFDNAKIMPAKISKSHKRMGQVTKYKLSKNPPLRIGKGGPEFHFHTLNGNIYIREIK